ncbi:MAG: hypothetical protein FWG98_03100 [Candidatus Cloacimonetes bacterium]|nr:hypothetical protein [Candidatus Cloacimonadota bacterium]
MLIKLIKAVEIIFNLAFPAVCYNCNRRISIQKECLCHNCLTYLERKKGLLKGEDELGERYFYKVASLYDYGHISRELIHIYKYKSIKKIGYFLANKAIEVLKSEYLEFINVDGILAVPMHKKRYQERHLDQARLLTSIISKSLKIKDLSSMIVKNTNSPKQALLDFEARLKNPINSFKIKNEKVFKDKTLLVIDDIFTTGATANALCKELITYGAKRIYVFVIAAGSVGQNYKLRKIRP